MAGNTGEEYKDCKSYKTREFAIRLGLLVYQRDIPNNIPIKSHQHDYPNMS